MKIFKRVHLYRQAEGPEIRLLYHQLAAKVPLKEVISFAEGHSVAEREEIFDPVIFNSLLLRSYLFGAPFASSVSHVLWRLDRWNIFKDSVSNANDPNSGTCYNSENGLRTKLISTMSTTEQYKLRRESTWCSVMLPANM